MRRHKIEAFFLFALFLQLIFDFIMRKAYLPWDPGRRWLDLGTALFFVIYIIVILIWLVQLNQENPDSGAEGTKKNLAFFSYSLLELGGFNL